MEKKTFKSQATQTQKVKYSICRHYIEYKVIKNSILWCFSLAHSILHFTIVIISINNLNWNQYSAIIVSVYLNWMSFYHEIPQVFFLHNNGKKLIALVMK